MKLELARLAGAALLGTGFSALVVAGSHAFELPAAPTALPARRSISVAPAAVAAERALAAAVAKAPFRERRISAAPYDPALVGAPPPPPAPPKPAVILAGIVWGSEPVAAIEGVPGNEGAVVLGVGDSAGGIRVRRIAREMITVVGYDTVWNLRIRGRA